MEILVLGGTAWVGREFARQAVARGHAVTCLARGVSGAAADGTRLVAADRSSPDAYDEVREHAWDTVLDVSWQPGFVRGAVAELAAHAAQWIYVSSGSVYADTDVVGADESAPLLSPLDADVDTADRDRYGEAKVACELACRAAVDGDRLLVVRSGLIGGPGDPFDRAGYWVARAARAPDEPLLVPDPRDCPSQVLDVRDLATWLVQCAEQRFAGTVNAVGLTLAFDEWLALSREVGGHTGELVEVPGPWLLEQGLDWFMGPESIAMWLPTPDTYGFSSRDGSAAERAGLRHRPRRDVVLDILADERVRGLDRERRAGLSSARERDLIADWTAGQH